MAKSKTLCSGCRNDYYNHNREGGCWSYQSARVVQLTKVGVWQNPPYKWTPRDTLSCHSPNGAVWINEDDPRVVQGAG